MMKQGIGVGFLEPRHALIHCQSVLPKSFLCSLGKTALVFFPIALYLLNARRQMWGHFAPLFVCQTLEFLNGNANNK